MARRIRDNVGSLARDQLANERTFLAWVRSSLAFIGLGVLLAKLVETEGITAEVAGLLMIAAGAVMLVYATWRFERVTALLDAGRYEAARIGPLVVAGVTLVVALGAVVLVVV
jgi:putative membrane protein